MGSIHGRRYITKKFNDNLILNYARGNDPFAEQRWFVKTEIQNKVQMLAAIGKDNLVLVVVWSTIRVF